MAPKYRIPFVSLLALSAAMPAFAQEGPQPPVDAEEGRDVIVITANKREETVQDVAVAVTAISSDAKQELGIITITDMTNVTPGLSYTPSNERVTLRGIGRLSNSIGADPGVANYTDGLYSSFATTAGRDAMLIERVEVLRGPQGTLYGRNAIGGAINIISKRPTDELAIDLKLGAGNYNYSNAVAAVSGPITDWLRYRVAAQREQRDGVDFNYGTGGNESWALDDYYIEAQLEGDIGDRFTWWFKTSETGYNKAGPPGGATSSFTDAPYLPQFNTNGATAVNPAFAYSNPSVISFTQAGSRRDNPFATNGEHAYNSNRAQIGTVDQNDEYVLEAVYSTDWFDIKYVGGYVYFDYSRSLDADGTPIESVTYNAITSQITAGPCAAFGANQLRGFPTSTLTSVGGAGCISGSAPRTIFPNSTDTYGESRAFFSNEINLISTMDGPLQWIGGIYQYQENNKQPGLQLTLDDEPLAASYLNLTTGTVIANPNRYLQYFANTGLYNAYGVYGQADYTLNDQLKFTAGLRYSLDVKESKEEGFVACYIICSGLGIPASYANITSVAFGNRFTATQAANGYTAGLDSRGFGVRRLKGDWEAVTGTAGVEYRPFDDTLTFAKYSRGYKAGGFNNLGFVLNPYTESEFVDSYEAGWKQAWADYGLTTNAAVFLYNYTDAQAPLTIVNNDGGIRTTSTAFVNLPEVQTTGFELESNWSPIDALNIGFTYAYLNTEITESDVYTDPTRDDRCSSAAAPTSLGTCVTTPGAAFRNIPVDPQSERSVEGNELSQSPKHKVAINASYRIDMEDGSYFLPTISYSWRDEFYGSFFNNENQIAPAFDNLDARLNWKSSDEVLGLTFWVRNLTDEEQAANVGANSFRRDDNGRYQNFDFSPPRTFGVDLLVSY
jgi:iron complex outermembrane receptor protein